MSTSKTYKINFHRPMCFWNANEVEAWLKYKKPKLALRYSGIFINNYVTGRVLVDLTEADLKEIGINNYEERQELLVEIKKGRLTSDLDEMMKLKDI
uniref:SAM domain-containing protein n=1 Tax=Parastrongyloides trichosuri TaxID=131310 RepID=A0A0N4ZYH8_PARTI